MYTCHSAGADAGDGTDDDTGDGTDDDTGDSNGSDSFLVCILGGFLRWELRVRKALLCQALVSRLCLFVS